MQAVYTKTKMLTDVPLHYCPGCTHGLIHKLIGEAIEELGLHEKTIGVAPIGCAGSMTRYMNCDMIQPPHGRAPAVASAIKRALPGSIVFTYQGDGDLGSIGNGEINNAVARGEKVTTVFINNTVYAMTGGQMAPTTMIGQKTTTTPYGRDANNNGFPMHVAEMVSAHEGAYYVERVAVDTIAHIKQAKRALKKAFMYQTEGKGYTFVEFLSSCPTNWGLDNVEALNRITQELIPYFPLGILKDGGRGV